MKVEIFYDAPPAQILTLSDEQADLFTEYKDALERARELQRSQGWTDESMDAYSRVDDAYDAFMNLVAFDLEYPDLDVTDIGEW